jgi:hypothetical protein
VDRELDTRARVGFNIIWVGFGRCGSLVRRGRGGVWGG